MYNNQNRHDLIGSISISEIDSLRMCKSENNFVPECVFVLETDKEKYFCGITVTSKDENEKELISLLTNNFYSMLCLARHYGNTISGKYKIVKLVKRHYICRVI